MPRSSTVQQDRNAEPFPFPEGEEALIDRLPASASEGATLRCRVTRAALAERDRRKLARATATDEPVRDAPSLRDSLPHSKVVRHFPSGLWEDLWLEAWSGIAAFDGGELAFFDTAAMTLIDIDGSGAPLALSLAAVPALADALHKFDLGGNIGVDFPTVPTKAERKVVDAALADALGDWPHERTAMNGFGFVQIVSRLERPSLLQRIHHARRRGCLQAAPAPRRDAGRARRSAAYLPSCHQEQTPR